MADPKKTAATSSNAEDAQTPGNGNVWGTTHDDGAPSYEGASGETEKKESPDPSDEQSGDAANDSGAGANAGASSGATTADEELVDAVLEAEAAAIVDEAMDNIRAEAEAKVADGQAAAAGNDADRLAKEAAEWKDKYVRLHAEWDTYRRRQKENEKTQKALAAEKLVNSLIPVVDDLERTIDYAQKNGETGLLSGVEAVLSKFVDTLKKDGVEVIDPKGEAFNALEAQAVGTVDDPSQLDETVADVYQRGYKIGTKVLRPAMVTVTTGGPARPKEETE